MSDDLKTQGNEALKQGRIYDSIQLYSEAIQIDPSNHIIFSNRSNAYYQDKNFAFALKDATETITLASKFEKGYIRAYDALVALNRFPEGVKQIKTGLTAIPSGPILTQKYQEFQKFIIPNLTSIQLITNPVPFVKNVPTVIECFATWCGPCKQMIPHLAKFQDTYNNRINLISVSSEPTGKLEGFLKGNPEMKLYNVGFDGSGVVQHIMGLQGVQGIPHCFVYDKDGTQIFSGHPSQLDQFVCSLGI
ncbi:putative FixW protein [Spironucleus salmonicida]|uniref:FixW protein n=1 Tax=Spironucleus salmonicida TaxID=348837 RepID=A0A9P8RYP6_9EUKA|nr:putative FixW protein [Spironucleus salmonicida]KAH0574291.1 putative FixW protein [Spironucleus salmonicida]